MHKTVRRVDSRNIGQKSAPRIYDMLRQRRPQSREELRNYVKIFLGLSIPDKRICPDHSSPMDYLWYAFWRDFLSPAPANGDAIVWANRGGGKTQLAAAATLLDLVFKPRCRVRILGGSGEQASRMYSYMLDFLGEGYEGFLAGKLRKGRCGFLNGSNVEVLNQSAASVRGQHIQKLRCDEVELFDRDVFEAAKFTTQSSEQLVASMELISTMHKPYGLMAEIISSAQATGTPVFKWSIWEVIEKCRDRVCSRCKLWNDCQGKAKRADGYMKIDDCITQMSRASRAGWESEMLCERPNLENVVFDEFDPPVHVRDVEYNPNLPLYRSMDFGFVNPFVCLWIQVDDGRIMVTNEYVRPRATIESHAREVKKRTPCSEENVCATFCDPAGAAANDVTGTSAVRELRSLGIGVRYRKSSILEGIELIRRAIRAGDGSSRLVVSPRCERLIEALRCYHYSDSRSRCPSELPEKDGVYDHPIDALRYFFVNHQRWSPPSRRRY